MIILGMLLLIMLFLIVVFFKYCRLLFIKITKILFIFFIVLILFLLPYFVSCKFKTGFFPLPKFVRAIYNSISYENDVLVKTKIDLNKENFFILTPKKMGSYCVAIKLRKNNLISNKEYDLWRNFTFIFRHNGNICLKVEKKIRIRSIYFEEDKSLTFCRFDYPLKEKYYKNIELEILPVKDLSFLQGYETELVVDFPYPK